MWPIMNRFVNVLGNIPALDAQNVRTIISEIRKFLEDPVSRAIVPRIGTMKIPRIATLIPENV